MQLEHKRRPSLDGEHFQVAVIGGGINGVAIARECARAGMRTLILEQHDFAAGTTSRSTRIIHGGLRYLEHGEVALVRESLRERERLLQERSHLVRPLRFVIALPPDSRRSALSIRAGLWLYGTFAAGQERTAQADNRALEQALDRGQAWSLFDYEDAQCEYPERLVAEWLGEAISAGAAARNYSQVLEVVVRDGAVRGVRMRDGLSGEESFISSDWVVNATGPWADQVCRSADLASPRMIGGVRGSHIVLRRFDGAPASAVYSEGADGRPVFVIPWAGQVLVGTTEIRDDGDPEQAVPAPEEIEYLLGAAQRLFPKAWLTETDIHYAFAGVRPLPYSPGIKPAAVTRRSILRDHKHDGAAGMISVIGGKLTTAASLARKCARMMGARVAEPWPAQVAPAPLDGIESSLQQWGRALAGTAGIPEASARAIAEWHGRRAMSIARAAEKDERLRAPLCQHTPHIVGEAVAAGHECAITLADIVLRRVPVALGACWSAECTRLAAMRIGRVLGWSESRKEMEFERCELERLRFQRKIGLRSPFATMPSERAA